MSGYSANIEAFIEVNAGNLIPYSTFELIRYIVHDANRIDTKLGNDYLVTTGPASTGEDLVQLYAIYSDECAGIWFPIADYSSNGTLTLDWSFAAEYPMCEFYWHVSEYAANYGSLGENQTKSTFDNSGTIVSLDSPSLNISAILWKQEWLDGLTDGTWMEWYEYPYG